MPSHVVSSFDQRVTQWMSTVTFSLGSSRSSSQVHVFRSSPLTIENVHSSSRVCGVGPAERTGKSWVTYWPGGTRAGSASSSRRLPRKPRETKLIPDGLPDDELVTRTVHRSARRQ